MPPQTQTQRRRKTGNNDNANEARRRRQSRHKHESDDSEASEEDQDGDVDMERTGDADDQLVKKLVRYALACEYARIPIKRDGIRDKGKLSLLKIPSLQFSLF